MQCIFNYISPCLIYRNNICLNIDLGPHYINFLLMRASGLEVYLKISAEC